MGDDVEFRGLELEGLVFTCLWFVVANEGIEQNMVVSMTGGPQDRPQHIDITLILGTPQKVSRIWVLAFQWGFKLPYYRDNFLRSLLRNDKFCVQGLGLG